ncbi:MAG: AAA family ATPase [Comamonadaceae bacterium]|nr:AAA family ATPase [Comamonadaceae bacterium]
MARAFVGQPHLVEHVLICLFSNGHALLEGLPGLGKTLLVKTLSEALDLKFSRIQCTPDLMPADVIGTNLLVEDARGIQRFEFQRGPLFGSIILVDEINRTTPKTQSAFLEAMQEHRVTVLGETPSPGGSVSRARYPEPDRARGDLSSSGGPTGPLPLQAEGRLPHH